MLVEHDAKMIASLHGLPVPAGVLVESAGAIDAARLPPLPWIVKAQVPVGGRGKAGLVRAVDSIDAARAGANAMIGARLRGHRASGVRIETRVAHAHEAYLALLLDPAAAAIRVLVAEHGGVDIEAAAANGQGVRSMLVAPDEAVIAPTVAALAAGFAPPVANALARAAAPLAKTFFQCEATLAEINPLFVLPDGGWLAADMKLALDENALVRQPELAALVEARRHVYPEAALKITTGFDYVEVDPEGTIGLVTTGAGLSMMLIDELRAQGRRPFNFVDIRTGQFRGNPTRLIQVLSWIARGPRIKVVLVNVFAGITHLGEFARLFVEALEAVPGLRVPIIARLIGNGFDEARSILSHEAEQVMLEPDLERAIAIAASYA